MQFINNNLQGNTNYSLYLQGGDVNATYNWWGTTNTQAINQTIYDFKYDFELGVGTFVPFLTAPNPEAPTFIDVSAGTGGSIFPSGILYINYGGSQTFTITANGGYHIADVLVNGTSVGAVSSCPIQNVNGATTISATFAPDTTPTPTSTASPTPTNALTTVPTSSSTTSTTTATPTSSATAEPSQTPAVPEFSLTAILALLILAVTPAIVLMLRKREKTSEP
jgi:hypothetical protein